MRRLRMTIGLLALVLLASLLPVATVSADVPAPSTTTLSGPASVEEGTGVVLTATVAAPDGYDTGATITFTALSGGGPDCTAVAVDTAGTQCDLGNLSAGSYSYEAAYSGNVATDPSSSVAFDFDVTVPPTPPPTPDPPAASTTALSDPGTVTVGDPIVLTATVTAPAGYDTGATITFTAISGGGPDCTTVAVDTSGTECDLSGLGAGTYTYEATYSGNATTDPSPSNQVTFDVVAAPPDPSPSTTALAGPGSVVVGGEAVLTATVTAPAGYETGATITFTAISGGGPDCTNVAVDTSGTTCHLASLPVGTYVYQASYSGNATTDPSTSSQVTFVVTAVPDTTLDASGVGTDLTTFYPVKDGYRDTLKVQGVRGEPITVTIRIYNASGTRVLLKTIASGAGAYAYGWSGRDSHGSVRTAGKYKIVQTLADGAGNTLVVTKFVTLSQKKLITRTTYVTKKGLSITAGTAGNIFVSKSVGYAKLRGTSGSPAMAGYSFTIPSAVVYKSIAFQVYGTGPTSSPLTTIGLQDMVSCPDLSGDWFIDCFDHWRSWSGTSAAWHTASGSASTNRNGTRVRGAIVAMHGTVVVTRVRVKVVYQVLG